MNESILGIFSLQNTENCWLDRFTQHLTVVKFVNAGLKYAIYIVSD